MRFPALRNARPLTIFAIFSEKRMGRLDTLQCWRDAAISTKIRTDELGKKAALVCGRRLGRKRAGGAGPFARRTSQRALDCDRRVLCVRDQLPFLQQMAGDKSPGAE